jgi:hypothetical protein
LDKALVGKREIRAYVRRSRQTIAAWIKAEEFPARKINGVRESDTDLVDAWRRDRILYRPRGWGEFEPFDVYNRLLKNAHLPRCATSLVNRHTSMYDSFLGFCAPYFRAFLNSL